MKPSRALCLVLVGLAAAACTAPEAGPTPKKKKRGRGPAKVKVAPARAQGLQDAWRFLGDVRAGARASVAVGASGAVTAVRVRIGDRVQRGQRLVQVDPDLAAAQVETAESDVAAAVEAEAQAKRELERLAALRENVVAEVERERAASTVRSTAAALARAKASLREARAVLARHRIAAPFEGVVAARTVDPGDWVQAGDPALELVSTEDLEIIVDASRALFGRISAGATATVVDGTRRAEAKVTGVVPALDPVSRTLRVRLVPTAAARWLVPGSSVDVEFGVELAEDGALSLPIDALLTGPDETRVVKVVDGKARPLVVQVLARARGAALVRGEGLVEGDLVVVRGNERLRPDQAVEVLE